MVENRTRGISELNEEMEKILADNAKLRKDLDAAFQELFTLGKTIEGIQNLFIRAGEYRGKPRGRLPR